MLYLANPTSPSVIAQMRAGRLGFIDTPAQANIRPAGVIWCADNGCFGKGYPGDAGYLKWLDKHPDRDLCLFATAPDVVGDAAATVARSTPFLEPIRQLGYRVALVAQNGLEALDVDWDSFDVLFLGGDTPWKLGPAARALTAQANARGKAVHMGRVNSERRLRYADHIGCASADGTFLTIAPDHNLARVERWLRGVVDQGTLWPTGPPVT